MVLKVTTNLIVFCIAITIYSSFKYLFTVSIY